MRVLETVAVAAVGALLALASPALACDYSKQRNVTAEAPQSVAPVRAAEEVRQSVAPIARATARDDVAPAETAAPAQTAEADTGPPPVALPN